MPKTIDLTGKFFNGWQVIKKMPSRNGKIYWLCECEKCHSQKEIQGTHLKNLSCARCNCSKQEYKINEIKVCPLCGKTFSPLLKGQTRKFCFECSPPYDKNKGRSQNLTAIRRALKKHLVLYKGGKCEICGYNKSFNALQFHHLNPQEKDFTISTHANLLSNFNIELYHKEVDKCILVCANCHAEIHEKDFLEE